MPSLSRIDEARGRGDDPLVPHPGLGQAEVERVVRAGRESPVDVDEVTDARHLRGQDDPVVAEPGLLGRLGRSHRRLEHRVDHHVAGVTWLGRAGVDIHQLGQERLVERAPVDPDPDRLVVVDGDPDDRREVLVVALRPDVAGIDPVLRERRGHLRILDQELVAVVVEVADDRHVHAEATDLADHLGDGGGGCVGVDRDPDQLRAGVREPGDLDGGRVGVGGIRVRHRLDDDRDGRCRRGPRRRRPTRSPAGSAGPRTPLRPPWALGGARRPDDSRAGAAEGSDDVEAGDPDEEHEQEDEPERCRSAAPRAG